MNTRSRLFYGGTLGALGLTMVLALNCNNDPGNYNPGPDLRGNTGGDGGGGEDGGTGDGGGSNGDGFNPGAVNLTMVAPTAGTNAGGTVLTLTGTNFPSDAQVYIDGRLATIQGAVTATQIMLQTPAAPSKKGKVLVEIRRNGNTVAMNANLFSYFLGTPGFDIPKTFDVGGMNPVGVILVDLNKNSRLDVVVANFQSNNVSVLLGQGNGSFGTAGTYATGSRPVSLVTANFDDDVNNHLDIATINSAGESVSVLINDGSGILGTAKTRALPVNTAPQGLAVGKLNGDGFPDVVTANSGNNDMSLLLGATGGMLGVPASLAADPLTPSVPNAVAIVDINRDLKLDVIVVNKFTSRVGVQLGDGNGGFTLKGHYNTGAMGPFEMAVADFNGDGIPDVATTMDGIAAPRVSVLLGQNDGALATGTQYTAGEANGDAPKGIAAGDLNGDGLADLVVALNASTKIAVLLAQQGGTFAAPLFYVVGPAPRGVAIGDLDGDGNPDIVTTTYTNNQISVLLNKFQ